MNSDNNRMNMESKSLENEFYNNDDEETYIIETL